MMLFALVFVMMLFTLVFVIMLFALVVIVVMSPVTFLPMVAVLTVKWNTVSVLGVSVGAAYKPPVSSF